MNLARTAPIALLAMAACSQAADATGPALGVDQGEVKQGKELLVEQRARVDLAELSGLALRDRGGALEVLAVGDADAKLALARTDDLSFVVKDAPARGQSQWEAVAVDGTGRVFALRENPGSILVFDARLAELEAEISLHVSGGRWADENSRGEGLVLLKNGHVLVLKEKDPLAIVEFGLEEDAAGGYRPGSAVAMGDAYPLPRHGRRRFVALKEWEIGKSSSDLARDGSELAVGPDGRLYLLSDQSRTLSLLEADLRPDEDRFKFDVTWRLPKGLDKPEGLAILPDGRPVVAVDGREGSDAVFVLSKLTRPR